MSMIPACATVSSTSAVTAAARRGVVAAVLVVVVAGAVGVAVGVGAADEVGSRFYSAS